MGHTGKIATGIDRDSLLRTEQLIPRSVHPIPSYAATTRWGLGQPFSRGVGGARPTATGVVSTPRGRQAAELTLWRKECTTRGAMCGAASRSLSKSYFSNVLGRQLHCVRPFCPTQAHDINALFGFRLECLERLGDEPGVFVWRRINELFNYLPLAAIIESKILCMHGGIGRCIHKIDQVGWGAAERGVPLRRTGGAAHAKSKSSAQCNEVQY